MKIIGVLTIHLDEREIRRDHKSCVGKASEGEHGKASRYGPCGTQNQHVKVGDWGLTTRKHERKGWLAETLLANGG